MRYRGLKGKLWNIFSKYIRLRDFITYDGHCITCGQKKSFEELQAGHYLAASNCGFGLLFDEENVHAECAYDNGFNPNHQMEYRKGLVGRLGEDRVAILDERFKDSHYRGIITKVWGKKEYEKKIELYKQKIKDLQLSTFYPQV